MYAIPRRGQAALKAMMALGIILFTFVLSYMLYFRQEQELFSLQRTIDERSDCWKVSNALFSAFMLGDGTVLSTTISHNLTIEPLAQRIAASHTFCTIPFSTASLNSTKLRPGKVTIHNQQGAVEVLT